MWPEIHTLHGLVYLILVSNALCHLTRYVAATFTGHFIRSGYYIVGRFVDVQLLIDGHLFLCSFPSTSFITEKGPSWEKLFGWWIILNTAMSLILQCVCVVSISIPTTAVRKEKWPSRML